MKLELKHLAPYLPYGLSFSVNLKDVRDNFPNELRTLKLAETSIDLALKIGKPILRPLSSITKEEIVEINELSPCNIFINITNNGDVFIEDDECFNEAISIELIDSIEVANWFFSKHFDVFGLIDRGLAIEK